MDKQIIIDGCNVSGCEYFRKDDPCKNTCHYFCTPCEWVQIQNCMYKYGKRKEQECEEFRKANDEKNELLAKLGCPTTVIAKRKVFCLQEQLDKLKQTLSDIKPILEVYADTKIGIEQPNGTYSMEIKDDKVIGGTYTITYNPNLAKTALDKINEVI